MSVERRGLAAQQVSADTGGRGEMIKAHVKLQGLRRRFDLKAKALKGLMTVVVKCVGPHWAEKPPVTCDVV